ncbi:hypothetical protein DFH28DRAFT_922805 [Melampsora americana]|nr:hypothetical protein DFH28DRAFT_922805 [Melampsora americana]
MPVTNGWTMHPIQCNKSISEAVLPCAANEVIRKNSLLVSLGNELQQSFLSLYETTYPAGNCYVGPQHMFTDVHVWKIIKNYQLLQNGTSLRLIFGSEPIKGTFQLILENLELWSRRDDFGIYLRETQSRAEKIAALKQNRPPTQPQLKSTRAQGKRPELPTAFDQKIEVVESSKKPNKKRAASGSSKTNLKKKKITSNAPSQCLIKKVFAPSSSQYVLPNCADRILAEVQPNTLDHSHPDVSLGRGQVLFNHPPKQAITYSESHLVGLPSMRPNLGFDYNRVGLPPNNSSFEYQNIRPNESEHYLPLHQSHSNPLAFQYIRPNDHPNHFSLQHTQSYPMNFENMRPNERENYPPLHPPPRNQMNNEHYVYQTSQR